MRTLVIALVGAMVGAAALGVVWATSGDIDGTTDVRISAIPHHNGFIELGLQQRADDGTWGETLHTEYRFIPPNPERGTVLYSSSLQVDVGSRADQVAARYQSYLFQHASELGEAFTEYFRREGGQDEELPNIHCVVDLNQPGIGALCDGLEAGYAGSLEQSGVSDYDAFREQLLQVRAGEHDFDFLYVTSVPLTRIVAETRGEIGAPAQIGYWIELIDPNLAERDNLYCMLSHGRDNDYFWAFTAESSFAAAGVLGIDLRSEVFASGEEQAAAVRRCADDGAVAIATTLAEPEHLMPAVQDALARGIPVISFNSGASVAAEVGTALHIALDDLQAGRVAGEEFNERGVEGHLLCIIHEPNNHGLLERCDGLEEAFNGTVERWTMTDRTATGAELYARLQAGDVDGVLALSTDIGQIANQVLSHIERQIPLATFGFSLTIADRVADGQILFAIFDHPEVQSYFTTIGAFLAERFRIDPSTYLNSSQLLITPTVTNAEEMRVLLDRLTAPQE